MRSQTNFDNSSNQHVIAHQFMTFFGPDMAQILSYRLNNVTRIQIMLFFGPGMAQIQLNSPQYRGVLPSYRHLKLMQNY
eukprot:6805508-Ditylum_brightwellii.AAC.1